MDTLTAGTEILQATEVDLGRASRLVDRLWDQALKPVGLSAGQFHLLAAVADQPGITVLELAHALALDRTTVSRALSRATKKRWLALRPGEGDRRRREAHLTDSGLKLVRLAHPRVLAAQHRLAETLGKSRASRLRLDLSALVSRLAKD